MKRKTPHEGPMGAARNRDGKTDVTVNAASDVAALSWRDGPRPWNLHMFTTACMLTAAALPAAADPARRDKAIALVRDMTAQMMRGLNAYRASPVRALRPAHKIVWQDGTTRLLHTAPGAAGDAAPVLIVPSLINRYDILDLDAQHSFAAYLRDNGFDPYILDWGAPAETEKTFRVDDYIQRRLYPALERLQRPHVMGYCMGGTMAAGAVAALADQSNVRSLTLLAAPWDFHAGDKMAAMRMRAFALSAYPVMQAQNVLPVDWIQALFAAIDPLFAFNKFRSFAGLDQNSEQARRFVIVEDWLNDGVDLAAPAATQVLEEWYGDNQTVNGVWTIGAGIADATAIQVPTLVVAPTGDRLVPAPSALAIAGQIVASKTHAPDIGHIGMMASQRARALVWEPLVAWLRQY